MKRGLAVKHGLLFGHDLAVAQWTFATFKISPLPVQAAVGIVKDNNLVGAILFQDFNNYNVEMSYYGPMTPTAGISRAIAAYVLDRFNAYRMTIRTNRKNHRMMTNLTRLGFKTEGVQRQYYGPFGDAALFVLFRDQLERIARRQQKELAS